MTQKNCFVFTLTLSQQEILKKHLEEEDFSFSTPPYTHFSAKKKGISLSLYTSGKCTLQGKEAPDFIQFFIEPVLLQQISLGYEEHFIDKTGRIGVDESGKGDFFGPLCVAGVAAREEAILALHKMGVMDSKKLTDAKAKELAQKIKKTTPFYLLKINPEKYNSLYASFKNLNTLLGWAHATVIENLSLKTGCTFAKIDQFAHERVVKEALKKKGIDIQLDQRHKGEEDIVVAAASILARAAFLEELEKLREKYQIDFPKGAPKNTASIGKKFIETYSEEELSKVAKLHFKTTLAITQNRPLI